MDENNLRSTGWFGRDGKDGFIYRSWMKKQGLPSHLFDGRPVIGICNTWSELTPCNSHFRELAQSVKNGIYEAGAASDLYGSLDKNRLLSHISKIYKEEEYRVRTAVAGAGIGLATVFRTGGSFFFVSEQGVRTEVTVFFKRTDNFREFKDQFRFISTQFYF